MVVIAYLLANIAILMFFSNSKNFYTLIDVSFPNTLTIKAAISLLQAWLRRSLKTARKKNAKKKERERTNAWK